MQKKKTIIVLSNEKKKSLRTNIKKVNKLNNNKKISRYIGKEGQKSKYFVFIQLEFRHSSLP